MLKLLPRAVPSLLGASGRVSNLRHHKPLKHKIVAKGTGRWFPRRENFFASILVSLVLGAPYLLKKAYYKFLIMRPSTFGASGRGPPGPALGTALGLCKRLNEQLFGKKMIRLLYIKFITEG